MPLIGMSPAHDVTFADVTRADTLTPGMMLEVTDVGDMFRDPATDELVVIENTWQATVTDVTEQSPNATEVCVYLSDGGSVWLLRNALMPRVAGPLPENLAYLTGEDTSMAVRRAEWP